MSTRNQKGRLSRKRTVTTFYHWNTYNLKFLGDSLPFLIFWRTTIHQPPQSILAAILKCLVTSLLTEHMKENWEQEQSRGPKNTILNGERKAVLRVESMIESPTQQKLTRNDKNSKRFRSSYWAKVGAAAKKNGRRGRGKGRGGEKLLSGEKPRPKICLRSQAKGVYDLQKPPEKSGWNGRWNTTIWVVPLENFREQRKR